MFINVKACVAEPLTPRTPDLVRRSSLTRSVVSLDKELYSTLSLFTRVFNWLASRPGEVAILLGNYMRHAKETVISSGRLDLWVVCL